MKNKIAKIRKHVADNRTYYAFLAGSVATSTVMAVATRNMTLLEVSRTQLEQMKQGAAIVYELKDQTLHLVNIPALEAAQAAL